MSHAHHDAYTCRCPHGGFDPLVFAHATKTLGRRAFLGGAAASAAAVALWPSRAYAADGVTVLKAARLFDGTTMRTPGVLVLRGDRIVSMDAGDAGSGATTIDLGDATIMPGLIDAHTHVAAGVAVSTYLARPGRSADSVAEAALLSIHNAQGMLRNGFTTIRDVGGGDGIDLAMRNAVAGGYVVGPRILTAGPALTITGGHGDENDLPSSVHVDQTIESGVSFGPYGFRERVREHVKRHVDLIKILATGGVLSYGDAFDVPQMNLDEIQAITDEAAKFGLKVAAHCHGDRGIKEAVLGGVHSIEHGSGVETATLQMMHQRDVALVPTIWALDSILVPGNPNKISQNGLDKANSAAKIRNAGMQRAVQSNVKIVYGTDAGVFPHNENNKDFALLRAMGMSDRGRLAAGLLADIAVFNGDPSQNIALLEAKPALVMLGGKTITLA
jgi:imidazolonepropionase-like amidohydrolase